MSDNEYIEHQALTLKNLEKYMTVMKVNTREYGNQTVVAVDDLMYLPTADVAEVKHGKWKIVYQNAKATVYECSECKHLTFGTSDYCICGARMDGEGE